jgi:anti-anti-sigma factor
MDEQAIPIKEKCGFKILQPRGALTVAGLMFFRKTVETLLTDKNKYIAVDFKNVSKMDSSTLGLLRNVSSKISSQAGMLCLFNASAEIREMLKVTNMEEMVNLLADEKTFEQTFNLS